AAGHRRRRCRDARDGAGERADGGARDGCGDSSRRRDASRRRQPGEVLRRAGRFSCAAAARRARACPAGEDRVTSSASPFDRRAVSRALTRVARMDVDELLREPVHDGPPAPRIGITGAPGVGKSSLIARLAHVRVEKASPLAIVAIDPTSPDSAGSLLGDRIRMEALAEDPRVYVRSMPSGQTRDGLGDNLPEVLSTLDSFGFAEIVVETVGVGQAEFGVRELVDVEVLLLMPGLGDSIQAMKAGILETADLIVINKADLAGARRTALELKTTLSQRRGVAVPH